MHHRTSGRRRHVTVYWLIALAATIPVIIVGFRLARPGPSHLATSADVSSRGGWGQGGDTMMPGPDNVQGQRFANAAATMSQNWAGYAVTGQQGSFTSVSASWTQPAVSCSGAEEFDAFWVGLDGDGTQTVEQTGTDTDCDQPDSFYQGWYEVYPLPPVTYNNPVKPGDAMSASVVSNGGNAFTLTLTDATEHWTHVTRQTSPEAGLGSAEIIAEAPSSGQQVLPLGNFGTLGFTGATVNGKTFGSTGDLSAITMASGAGTLAAPSALNGSAFSVTWHNSGVTATSSGSGGGGGGSGSGGAGSGSGGGSGGGSSGGGGQGGSGSWGGQGNGDGQGNGSGWGDWGQGGWWGSY
jgi:hypothetical protein